MFTAVDDRNHRAAQYDLLPFVVGLLGEGSMPRKGQRLPVGDPSALTHDTITALEGICRQATPAFLCRVGWEELDYIDDREQRRKGRIWQTLRGDEPLTYSHAAVDTLVTVYNMSRVSGREETTIPEQVIGVPPACDGTGQVGDQLIHHMAMLRFANLAPNLNKQQTVFFADNPLNAMARFDAFDQVVNLDSLLTGPIARWLPWLGRLWARLWNKRESARWADGADAFILFNERQSGAFSVWMERVMAIERLDLLSPLLTYYTQAIEAQASEWNSRFTELTPDMQRSQRQQLAESRVQSLEPAVKIGRIYNQTRGIHPVDREPPQQLFMELFTACEFDQVVETVERHREELLPSIG